MPYASNCLRANVYRVRISMQVAQDPRRAWWQRIRSRLPRLTVPSWPSCRLAKAASSLAGSLASWALLAWAAGFLFFATRLVAGLARLAWISAHGKHLLEDSWMHTALELSNSLKIARPVRLLQCDHPAAM